MRARGNFSVSLESSDQVCCGPLVRPRRANPPSPSRLPSEIVKTADDLWKILTFVRSRYDGPAECKYGCKGS